MIQRFSAETRFFDYSNLADEIKKILEDFTNKKYKISSDHYGKYIAITFTDINSKGFKNTVLDLTIPIGSGSEDDSPELTGTLNDFTFDAEEIDGIQWKGLANDRTIFEVNSVKFKKSLEDVLLNRIPKQQGSLDTATNMKQEVKKVLDAILGKYTVSINEHMPIIKVVGIKGNGVFFAQGEEAQDILDDVPEGISSKDYVLYYLDSAGALDTGSKQGADMDKIKTAAEDDDDEDQAYTFDELDDNGKENVINWLAEDVNLSDEVKYFSEEGSATEIFENIKDVYYQISYSQGDYANFDFSGLTEEYVKKTLLSVVGNKEEAELLAECLGISANTTSRGRTGRSVNIDLEWANTPDESDIAGKYFELYEEYLDDIIKDDYEEMNASNVKEALEYLTTSDFDKATEMLVDNLIDQHQRSIESAVEEAYEDACGTLYKDLKDTYESITSEEYIKEMCEANDYVFDEDGKLVR